MKSPFTGKEMILQKEKRIFTFRKEEIEIDFLFYLCKDTGEKIESENLAEFNHNQVMNKYRERLNLPFREEIIKTREKYGLPALTMSSILGFGPNTFRNYENGEVPSVANARLIQLIDDPNEFIKMVKLTSELEDNQKEKIIKKVETIPVESPYSLKNIEKWFLYSGRPDEFNGYKVFDFERTLNMVLFFAEKMQPWKTVINKLLFYCDFLNYRFTGYSISGMNYRAIPLGPVPSNFDVLYGYLQGEELLAIEYIQLSNENLGEKFIPGSKRQFNPDILSSIELKIIQEVLDKFKGKTTKEIVDYSHNEKAWIENQKEKKIISYSFALDMEI